MNARWKGKQKPPVSRSKIIKLSEFDFIDRMAVLENRSGIVRRNPSLDVTLSIGGLRSIIILMEVLRRTTGKTMFEPKLNRLNEKFYLPDTGFVPFFEYCMSLQLGILEKSLPFHELHPVIRLFADFQRTYPQYTYVTLAPRTRGADLFLYSEEMNKAIEKIRSTLSNDKFIRASNDFIRSANKNYKTLTDYVRILREKHKTLWVIRLDLSYSFFPNTPLVEYKNTNVQVHREKFLAFLRSESLVKKPLGYSWKLECGFNGTWRYHFLLFFAPRSGSTPVEIGDLLGAHWVNKITAGIGLYRNCASLHKEDPRRLGTGTISDSTPRRIIGLDRAVRYMTQLDYYAKLRPGERVNTFYGGDKGTATKRKPTVRKPRKPRNKLQAMFYEVEQRQAMPRHREEAE